MFEEIESKWTEDSGDYDDMIQKQLSNKRTVSYWTKELKSLLGPEPLRILEVGCGPGFMRCVQRSWTTLAGVSPVTVIASEPCS